MLAARFLPRPTYTDPQASRLLPSLGTRSLGAHKTSPSSSLVSLDSSVSDLLSLTFHEQSPNSLDIQLVRAGRNMAPASLLTVAQTAMVQNVSNLKDVGEIKYELLQPILKPIVNPQQLKNLETKSPSLADHTAELWKAFIARDIPHWQEKLAEPANPRLWWKVYSKLWRSEQDNKNAQEEQLQLASRAREEKQSPKIVFAGKVLQEPKRDFAFIDGQPNPLANSSGKIRVPALKNARTGTYLAAMRKEVVTARKGRGLGTVRPVPQTVITKAPASMVAEHAEAARRVAWDCERRKAARIAFDSARRPAAQRRLPSSRPLPPSSNSTRPRPPRAQDKTASDIETAWELHPGMKKAAENSPQGPKRRAEGAMFQEHSKRQRCR